jgi:hypothetical protein
VPLHVQQVLGDARRRVQDSIGGHVRVLRHLSILHADLAKPPRSSSCIRAAADRNGGFERSAEQADPAAPGPSLD